MDDARRVLLTGATGYIGGRLAPRLLDAGYRVRCLVRSPGKLRDRAWASDPRVEIVEQDIADEGSLVDACRGCDAAFYLVHSMVAAGSDYAARDRELGEGFSRACAEAGVGRIVYLGGLGETGDELSEHLSSRREVEESLRVGGVPVTVLRAAMIIGSGSGSFEILRYLVERLPVMVTPRWVSTQCQPIAVRNVLEYLVGCLDAPETAGGTYDIGGQEVMTYREIMRVMAAERGLTARLVIPVPVLTPKLSSYWIHLVTPISAKLARPLAEGLRNRVVVREGDEGGRIERSIPIRLLTVRESIRRALDKVAADDVETVWSAAGVIPGDPDWAGGSVFTDARSIEIDATPSDVFRAVCRVGGGHGWYAAGVLWKVRGLLDRLVGGPGLRRGRRSPEDISYGEALDFWRVTGLDRPRRLALRAEMKLPGEALLEFTIEPIDGASDRVRLTQTARFIPKGLLGLAYWYAVLPAHHFVFNGMLRGIKRAGEHLHARGVRDGASAA